MRTQKMSKSEQQNRCTKYSSYNESRTTVETKQTMNNSCPTLQLKTLQLCNHNNSADGPKNRARQKLEQENDTGTQKMCELEQRSRCNIE
ncbi:hypothetical protein A2U01_0007708 [Trifolium medium]|uniref:Uncharacterized protein n=1 Tax=Trifolium medium TaxID=97028 RepID=A0A392MJF3_9FABA|nr:hypothetical protein [Trifolium medium]